MVEVDVQNRGPAVVPCFQCDREVKEDHAFGRITRVDKGLSQERFRGHVFERREGYVGCGEVRLFRGAGGKNVAIGRREGRRKILDKERKIQAVGDPEGRGDIEVVLDFVAAYDEGAGLEDDVRGIDGGVGDLKIRDPMGGKADKESDRDAKDDKGNQDGGKKIPVGRLMKMDFRHSGFRLQAQGDLYLKILVNVQIFSNYSGGNGVLIAVIGVRHPEMEDLCPIFLHCVFLQQYGEEGGSGNGDERSGDSGEGGSEEQRDEDGEPHEVDAGAHDPGDEVGVFEVDVDDVKDEDAKHLGPGVEGGDDGGEGDGDDASGYRDDVEQTHEEAEQDEVADVQESEDDGAGEAKDEHQQSLAEEPLADFPIGAPQGGVKTDTPRTGEEGEEEVVRVLALEHEVDTEQAGGDDVEDMGEPKGEICNEVAGRGGDRFFRACGYGVDIESSNKRQLVKPGDEAWNAVGEFVGEEREVAYHGRKTDKEEEREDESYADQEENDGHWTRGMVAANSPV